LVKHGGVNFTVHVFDTACAMGSHADPFAGVQRWRVGSAGS
jgi:hypothetical protein